MRFLWVAIAVLFIGGCAASSASADVSTSSGSVAVGTTVSDPSGSALTTTWEDCDASGTGTGTALTTGVDGADYTVQPGDVGNDVCAYDLGALDAIYGPVVPGPTGTHPTISGTAVEGQPLSLTQGAWNAGTTITDQWEDCDSNGTACTPISGATGLTYSPTRADVGSTIEVLETASQNGQQSSARSAATAAVVPTAPSLITAPAITGSPLVGNVLSATTGSWTNQPTGYAYQWQRCGGGICTDIPGATQATYTPVSADVGDVLEVDVTASVFSATGQAYPSPPTGAVVEPGSGVAPISGSGSTSRAPGAHVALGRLTATLRWTFRFAPSYTQVLALEFSGAKTGATITVRCSGRGCPFSKHRQTVSRAKACRSTKTKPSKRCPGTREVNLTSTLRGHRLHVGTKLIVTLSQGRYVGQYYRFTVRARKKPATAIACLAPGSTRPGKGCARH